eukprot:GHVS01069267.1.p1 GENE.GHVS01069267.1~~GHVS01069267.1.p1  ORF type:complete len:272 (+),score=103.97 GHVS01069267.1:73-888(+)
MMVSAAQKKSIRQITSKLIREQKEPASLSLRVVKEHVIGALELPEDFFDKKKNEPNRLTLKAIVDEVLNEVDEEVGKDEEEKGSSEGNSEQNDGDDEEEEKQQRKRKQRPNKKQQPTKKKSSGGGGEGWSQQQSDEKEKLKKVLSQLSKGPSMYRNLDPTNPTAYLKELTQRIISFCHNNDLHSEDRLPTPKELIRFKQQAARSRELEGLDVSNIIDRPKRIRQEEVKPDKASVGEEEEESEIEEVSPSSSPPLKKKKKDTSDDEEDSDDE